MIVSSNKWYVVNSSSCEINSNHLSEDKASAFADQIGDLRNEHGLWMVVSGESLLASLRRLEPVRHWPVIYYDGIITDAVNFPT